MGSGFKTFAASEVLTAANLNNYCQNQSVMYFSSTGARDVAITSPVDGMTAYIGSNDSSEGLYSYNGTAWRKGSGWNAPWGVLGTQSLTSITNTAATHTTLQATGLTLGVTTVSNRRLRITSTHNFTASGGTNGVLIQHRAAATNIFFSSLPSVNATSYTSFTTVSHYATAATGSLTIDAYFAASTNNTTVNDNGNASNVRFLIIEDIGPSGAPV